PGSARKLNRVTPRVVDNGRNIELGIGPRVGTLVWIVLLRIDEAISKHKAERPTTRSSQGEAHYETPAIDIDTSAQKLVVSLGRRAKVHRRRAEARATSAIDFGYP